MAVVLFVFKSTVCVLLSAIQLAMMARAIMSWFPIEPNKFTQFLNIVTEPVIYPVRKLFDKMNWFTGLPIDMSFMAAFLLISVLLLILA